MNRIPAGSHSSKLQHRAPLEIHPNLSHVRKTLGREFLFHPCNISRCCRAVASVLRGSLAYRGSLYCRRTAQNIFCASSTKLFCIQNDVKSKANEACKYPLIHKEAVRKSRKSGRADPRAGSSPLDNRPQGRHPDCPLGPSLVVSRIALTVRGSTYRHRSEQFAATIPSRFLATAVFDDRDVGVPGTDQFSCADDYVGGYLPFADDHDGLCKLDFGGQRAIVPHHQGYQPDSRDPSGIFTYRGRFPHGARAQSIYRHQ